MSTLTRPVSSVKTALRPLMMTSVELVSRKPDEFHLEQGHVIYDERTITILSREPLHPTAIRNVTKQNKGYRLESLKCELYQPVIDVYYTACEF
jgi:hypothetical protein